MEPWIRINVPYPTNPIADVLEREISTGLRLELAAELHVPGTGRSFWHWGAVGNVEDSRAPAWSTGKAGSSSCEAVVANPRSW